MQAEIEILRSRSVLGAVVDNLKLDIYAAPDLSPVGAALARRKPADERPMIKVDSLDCARVDARHLVQPGRGRWRQYELFDANGELLVRGTVGNVQTSSCRAARA